MKYDLEEMLKESFSQKEKPSEEFYQSVLGEMKNHQKQSNKIPVKGIVTAACVAVTVISIGVVRYQLNMEDKIVVTEATKEPASLDGLDKKSDNATESPTPVPTQSPGNQKDDETVKKKDSKSSESLEDNTSDSNSTKSAKKVKNDKSKNEERDKKVSDSKKQSKNSKKNKNKSDQPEDKKDVTKPQQIESPEENQDTPSESDENNSTTETPVMEEPEGGYVTLCSLEQVSFVKENPGNSDVSIPEDVDSINTVVTSQLQLQEVIEKVKKGTYGFSDSGSKQMIEQLEKYDSKYFESNALYIGNIFEKYGYKFSLDSVKFEKEQNGNNYLKIILNKSWTVPDSQIAPDTMVYTNFFVQLPNKLVQACADVSHKIVWKKTY